MELYENMLPAVMLRWYETKDGYGETIICVVFN
jgi:hypothetical protein